MQIMKLRLHLHVSIGERRGCMRSCGVRAGSDRRMVLGKGRTFV